MSTAELAAVAERLRAILAQHADQFAMTRDDPDGVALEIRGLEGRPMGYVAGTRVGKSHVSYYLMPVYASPSLVEGMSPGLRHRMQGKACFNFTRRDDPLFAELAVLTARGLDGYEALAREMAAARR